MKHKFNNQGSIKSNVSTLNMRLNSKAIPRLVQQASLAIVPSNLRGSNNVAGGLLISPAEISRHDEIGG